MRALLIAAGVLLCGTPLHAADPAPSFKDKIAPLLTERCLRCHAGKEPTAGLNLTTREAILKGGKKGPAIVPGKSGESLLYDKVVKKQMPFRSKPLTEDELKLLQKWIDSGAAWEGPALSAPKPTGPLPPSRKEPAPQAQRSGADWWSFQPIHRPPVPSTIRNDWCHSAVDAFILARLFDHKLKPSAEADRRTYIRRVTLDLTGLMPTPEETETFINDRSADAYEKLVDRLLASPHYGERWGQHWLDIVRFAESSGYENNVARENAWPYRDYVIRSFNEDRPYARFVREQLAGDALANGDPLVDAATGFLVSGPTDLNVTQVVAANLLKRQNDLDDMIGTTGSAFMGLTVNCARCHDHKFDPISQKDYYGLQAVLSGIRHDEHPWRDAEYEQRRREEAKARAELALLYRKIDEAEPLASERGATPARPAVNPRRNVERFAPVSAKILRMTITATVQDDNPALDEIEVWSAGETPRNLALAIEGGKEKASSEGGERFKMRNLNDGRYGSDRIWVSGLPGKGLVTIEFPQTAKIDRVVWSRDRLGKGNNRLASAYTIEVSTDGKEWKAVAGSWDRLPARKPGSGAAAQPKNDNAERAEWLRQVDRLEKHRAELLEGRTVYAGAFKLPDPAFILKAGDPTVPLDEVGPSAIRILGKPLAADASTPDLKRRLALADWILDEANPLPDRVMVNRIWHHHFGAGLVRTPGDFGFNGDRPSHPELARLAGSRVPRQRPARQAAPSAHRSVQHLPPSEPGGPASTGRRCRLPAAVALSAAPRGSGGNPRLHPASQRLSGHAHGRSRLQALGPVVEVVVQYTPKEKLGPETYRRMVYQFRPRIHKDETFGAFDCPETNLPTPKRTISTTALQALNLLNSPFILEQSEHFAERLSRDIGNNDPAAHVRRAFAIAFGREPTTIEQDAAVAFIREQGLAMFCRTLFNANEFVYVR